MAHSSAAHEHHEHSHSPEHTHDHDQHDHAHESHEHDHDNHSHKHDHQHDHTHAHHDHDHHDHGHSHGPLGWLVDAIPFLHGHSHGEVNVDTALETSDRGLWALKISLLGLGATALFQLIIVLISGSAGLLADTIHNFSDALTAIPLGIAFVLGKKLATRRYTYGFGRAEDLAGVVIVLMIFLSSLVAGYESIIKLLHPEPLRNVWWVMVASIIGFLGNEGVAIFRIRVGKEIGSAALVADGQHARVDGLTSLAVLFGALGSLLGLPLADPIIGLLITVAILFIVKDTARTMWHRLMDAVDPAIVDKLERVTRETPGVQQVRHIRARWLGHKLSAEMQILVNENLSLRESNQVVENVRHNLFHAQPRLASISVHAQPDSQVSESLTAHHEALAL
ncbi:putative cation efflux system protein [Ktedonobacter sp. SOSP1-85]|uniref:cation diffusion facilitator family transporter n=1 Tax=Ktedonobacter sp. SOSP1-85 TaxID=2778367 RepID=UPI0019169026|nr:cation diffusion facilitator family transporter [Ktedonobacter sp. SOSP1-85]GHO78660.1 putative cation efflux system protein [Ktedonobacter sp. SOSP1-85]